MHKYLDGVVSPGCQLLLSDMAVNDEKSSKARRKRFNKQIKKYGFADSETWELENVMIMLLYERLKMYLDESNIDLGYHKCNVPVLHERNVSDEELSELVHSKYRLINENDEKIDANTYGAYESRYICFDVTIEEKTQGEAIDLLLEYAKQSLNEDMVYEDLLVDDQVKYEYEIAVWQIYLEIMPVLWW